MSEETSVTTEKTIVAEVTDTAPKTTVTMTADQLLALSETEWNEFKVAFETALAAKAAEEKAALKAKITAVTDTFKTYALPVIKYVAGAAILLKVFNVI